MTLAFVFPGQGSQSVGMLDGFADAPTVQSLLARADEALGEKLSSLIAHGPAETLSLTVNTQPAMLVAGYACWSAWRDAGGPAPVALAGHSLGEYTALAAAGAIAFDDAIRLVRLRAQAMQEAVPVGEGAMAAVLGLDFDAVQALAAEAAQGEVCAPANDNAPGQVVLSGHAAAIDRAIALASARRAKAIRLPVSAPFHCELLRPAADAMEEALAGVRIVEPAVPLIANVTAQPVQNPEEIRRLLVEQVTAPVRWRESVLYMRAQEVEELVEIGAGKVLTGLTRRIDPALGARAVQGPDDVDALLKAL